MNALEVLAARCAVALVAMNASEALCAVWAVGCTQDAELCSMDERELVGEEKRSHRRLTQNHRLPKCPMNPEDLECDSDMRS